MNLALTLAHAASPRYQPAEARKFFLRKFLPARAHFPPQPHASSTDIVHMHAHSLSPAFFPAQAHEVSSGLFPAETRCIFSSMCSQQHDKLCSIASGFTGYGLSPKLHLLTIGEYGNLPDVRNVTCPQGFKTAFFVTASTQPYALFAPGGGDKDDYKHNNNIGINKNYC